MLLLPLAETAFTVFNMYSIDFESQMPLFNTLYDIVFISKKYNGQLEDLMKKLHIK